MRPSFLFLVATLALSALAQTAYAQADEADEDVDDAWLVDPTPREPWVLQGGGRILSGLGSSMGDAQENRFITETGLRGELLFGRPGNRSIRIGPAAEIRTGHFSTLEYAGGLMALFPTAPGWPIQLSVLGGYAHRFRYDPRPRVNGAILVSTLAFGYRSFNYRSTYGVGINFYVSGRVHLDNPRAYDITGGLEFDIATALVVPVLMMRMAAQREDPDEYEEESDAPEAP